MSSQGNAAPVPQAEAHVQLLQIAVGAAAQQVADKSLCFGTCCM